MNDWLEIMLGEIDRKKQESEEAREEAERRNGTETRRSAAGDDSPQPAPDQSK